MSYNTQKFNFISFSSSLSSVNINVYFSPSLDIINPPENVLDLGINMSRKCSFELTYTYIFYVKNVLICLDGFYEFLHFVIVPL